MKPSSIPSSNVSPSIGSMSPATKESPFKKNKNLENEPFEITPISNYDDEKKTQSISLKSFDSVEEITPERSIIDLNTPTILTSMEYIGKEPSEKEADQKHIPESMCQVFLQSFLPFFLGGCGSILAGLLLMYANRTISLVKEVPEFLALMPPLQGLKGNLDMTFSSRMSTLAHLGAFERDGIQKKIWRNIAVIEAQSVFVSLVANLVSILIMFVHPDIGYEDELDLRNDTIDSRNETTTKTDFANSFVFLGSSSCISMGIICAISAFLLAGLVALTRKRGFNPDNIVTPLGASVGDLFTISSMLLISYLIRPVAENSLLVPTFIIAVAVLSIPVWLYLARKDESALKIAKEQCFTLLFAAAVSCCGGYIQSIAATKYPNYPAYQTLISGLSGNRCAVQASRISSYIEVHKKSELGWRTRLSPLAYYTDKCNESKTARLLLLTSLPFQTFFVLLSTAISLLISTPIETDWRFFLGYSVAVFLQVMVIMYFAQLLVMSLWVIGLDPDVHSIPLLTSTADVCGCGLLYLLFISLDACFECVDRI